MHMSRCDRAVAVFESLTLASMCSCPYSLKLINSEPRWVRLVPRQTATRKASHSSRSTVPMQLQGSQQVKSPAAKKGNTQFNWKFPVR